MNRNSYPERVQSALFHAIKKTAANLDACVKVPGKDFSRKRKLPLQTMLLEEGILHAVRLKRKNITRKKKEIATAIYLYQVDYDGEWG